MSDSTARAVLKTFRRHWPATLVTDRSRSIGGAERERRRRRRNSPAPLPSARAKAPWLERKRVRQHEGAGVRVVSPR